MKALERRIKRTVYAPLQSALVLPAPGWTDVTVQELTELAGLWSIPGASQLKVEQNEHGDLRLEGLDFRHLIELPLRLLTVSDVLWLLQSRHVGSFGELTAFYQKMPWEIYVPPGASVSVRVESYRSRLFHEGKIAELIRDALRDAGFRVEEDEAAFRLVAMQHENRHQLYFSLAGVSPLFHRRYKAERGHRAPLQEHLAAAALRWFSALQGDTWKPDLLCIPFAGSGTFLGEYLLQRRILVPFAFRDDWAIAQSPCLPQASWKLIQKRLRDASQEASSFRTQLIERASEQVQALRLNVQRLQRAAIGTMGDHEPWRRLEAGESSEGSGRDQLSGLSCELLEADTFAYTLPDEARAILMPLNPPYGHRLSQGGDLEASMFYRKLGRWLRRLPAGHQDLRGFVLVPDAECLQAFRRELGETAFQGSHSFTQGGLHIRCVAFRVMAAP